MDILLIIVAAIVALIFLGIAVKRKATASARAETKARMGTLVDLTRDFISRVETDGAFSTLQPLGLHLQNGEFAILHEAESTLYGFRPLQVAVEKGEHGVAGISLFPVVRAWRTESELDALAKGALYLTNLRILFISDSRNLAIPWRNLLSIKALPTGFQVHTNDSESPVTFTAHNGILWTILGRWMSSTEIKTPKLAPGTKLTLKPGAISETDQVVYLTVSTTD